MSPSQAVAQLPVGTHAARCPRLVLRFRAPPPINPMSAQCPWLLCPASCFPGGSQGLCPPLLLPVGGECSPCTTGLGPASEDLIFWAAVGLVPPPPPISGDSRILSSLSSNPGADLEGGGWTWSCSAAIAPSNQRLPPPGHCGHCHRWSLGREVLLGKPWRPRHQPGTQTFSH